MSRSEAIERRLSAVERAIAGGDGDIATLADAGDRERRLRAVEGRLERMEESIAELEAATQALRGYVGHVRSVNDDVEQRADAALAAVERLEGRLGGTDREATTPSGRAGERSEPATHHGRDRSNTGAATSGPDPGVAGGDAPSTLDELDAGVEMPVPGALNGTGPADPDERETDDDGMLDRVRDAL